MGLFCGKKCRCKKKCQAAFYNDKEKSRGCKKACAGNSGTTPQSFLDNYASFSEEEEEVYLGPPAPTPIPTPIPIDGGEDDGGEDDGDGTILIICGVLIFLIIIATIYFG